MSDATSVVTNEGVSTQESNRRSLRATARAQPTRAPACRRGPAAHDEHHAGRRLSVQEPNLLPVQSSGAQGACLADACGGAPAHDLQRPSRDRLRPNLLRIWSDHADGRRGAPLGRRMRWLRTERLAIEAPCSPSP